MMKKLILAVALTVIMQPVSIKAASTCITNTCGSHVCACKTTSQSFFSIRPVFTVVSPEYIVHNHDFYKNAIGMCGWGGAVQATILGGKSTHSDAIARFFLPFCRTTLNVTEQPTATTDILANQLNIYTQTGTFASTVEFKPHHSYIGLGINYQQKLYERCNGSNIWFSISGPILHVRNRIELIENITNSGGGPLLAPGLTPPVDGTCPASCPNSCNTDCLLNPTQALPPVSSVVNAFKQPGWCFGRIDNTMPSQHKTTKIGDVTIRLGYESVNRPDCKLNSFIGVIVPSGNRPDAIQLFEPIAGHNHHWGWILGSDLGLEIWKNCTGDLILSGEFTFAITDFLHGRERRSFDLKYKPWSRYMQFYRNIAQAQLAANSVATDPQFALILHTPGIDIMTQNLKVKPGYYRAFNVDFIMEACAYELEVGYNFFARQAECLSLDCAFPTGVALKAIDVGGGATGTYQTINSNLSGNCLSTPVANYNNNIITLGDLDLESAAHPATLTHTVYASLAHHGQTCCGSAYFIGVGGSYEFPPDNVGLNRWMLWAKTGIAF